MFGPTGLEHLPLLSHISTQITSHILNKSPYVSTSNEESDGIFQHELIESALSEVAILTEKE